MRSSGGVSSLGVVGKAAPLKPAAFLPAAKGQGSRLLVSYDDSSLCQGLGVPPSLLLTLHTTVKSGVLPLLQDIYNNNTTDTMTKQCMPYYIFRHQDEDSNSHQQCLGGVGHP